MGTRRGASSRARSVWTGIFFWGEGGLVVSVLDLNPEMLTLATRMMKTSCVRNRNPYTCSVKGFARAIPARVLDGGET